MDRARSSLAVTRQEDEHSEARAFSDGVEPHLPKMLALARRLARENAEDIVQDELERASGPVDATCRAEFDIRDR